MTRLLCRRSDALSFSSARLLHARSWPPAGRAARGRRAERRFAAGRTTGRVVLAQARRAKHAVIGARDRADIKEGDPSSSGAAGQASSVYAWVFGQEAVVTGRAKGLHLGRARREASRAERDAREGSLGTGCARDGEVRRRVLSAGGCDRGLGVRETSGGVDVGERGCCCRRPGSSSSTWEDERRAAAGQQARLSLGEAEQGAGHARDDADVALARQDRQTAEVLVGLGAIRQYGSACVAARRGASEGETHARAASAEPHDVALDRLLLLLDAGYRTIHRWWGRGRRRGRQGSVGGAAEEPAVG